MEEERRDVEVMAMILALTMVQAVACPDRDALLRRAEEDVSAQFLADAQQTLGEVVEAFACGGPVTSEQHRRYWQAQGVAWSYVGDPRADQALRVSGRRESSWNAELYGAASPEKEAFDLGPMSGPTSEVVFRDLGVREVVFVDGEARLPPIELQGPHILQVGDATGVRFATVLLVEGPSTVRLPPPGLALPTLAPPAALENPPRVRTVEVEERPNVTSTARDLVVVAGPNVAISGEPAACVRERGANTCRPLAAGRVDLPRSDGLVPVEIVSGSEVESRVYWVDGRSPDSGRAHALQRRDHTEVLVVGAGDRQTWIAGWIVARDKDCADPIAHLQQADPRLRLPADLGKAYVCAVDAAGNRGAGTLVRTPRRREDVVLDFTSQERVAFVDHGAVGHAVREGAVCTGPEPGCTRFGEASRPLRPALHPSDDPHTLYTRSREGRVTVRHFLYDEAAPEVGRSAVESGDPLLWWSDVRDDGSGVAAFLVGWGERAPLRCAPDSRELPVHHPFTAVPSDARVAWICAVDRAGNVSAPHVRKL